MSMEEMQWAEWPLDRPLPTEAEYLAAQARHRAECKEAISNGYSGDMLCGLSFTMATYTRPCWWHFFFPEEKMDLMAHFNGALDA